MLRTLTTAALAVASLAAFASPTAAQTSTGITLSFGSGSYGNYGNDYGAATPCLLAARAARAPAVA